MTTRVSITVESEKAGELTVSVESPADLVEVRRHLVDQVTAGAKAALAQAIHVHAGNVKNVVNVDPGRDVAGPLTYDKPLRP